MVQDMSKVYVNLATAPTANTDFGGGVLWQETSLTQQTIMQSLAFDYKSNPTNPAALYLIQCKNGSADGGSRLGELVVNKVNSAGANTGSAGMTLNHLHDGSGGSHMIRPDKPFYPFWSEYNGYGFGHGSQIAIEYAPDGTYLWIDHGSPAIARDITQMDLDSPTTTATMPNDGEWDVGGLGLCRVKFVEGATYLPNDSHIQRVDMWNKMGLLDGQLGQWDSNVKWTQCSIDNINKRIAVAYCESDDYEGKTLKMSIFSYDYNNYVTGNVNSINFTLVKSFTIPKIDWWLARDNGYCSSAKDTLTPQGFALFGDRVYFMNGSAYWTTSGSTSGQQMFFSPDAITDFGGKYNDGTSIAKVGNHFLTRYNWQTGTVEEQIQTEAGKSDTHREPQGMHIIPQVDGSGNVTALTLYWGLAGGITGARHWGIFQKYNTVPQP